MKIFIPQVGEEFKLERSWNIELDDYNYDYFKEHKSHQIENEAVFHKGTIIKIMSFNLYRRHKISNIIIKIVEINGKKLKNSPNFAVELNDFNRIHIEDSATQGVLNIDLNWDSMRTWRKGSSKQNNSIQLYKHVGYGYVNKTKVFQIKITELVWTKKTITNYYGNEEIREYIEKIKYGVYELISGDEEFLGEWGTTQTCKKHALEFLNKNKSQFFDKNQKIILRAYKFERILDEIENDETK